MPGRIDERNQLPLAMSSILALLNDNAGAFNLLFTAVVAAATVVYAVLTARLVRETQRLREVATEPAIEVTYRSRAESMALLEIVVKNIGSGPAYRVEFEVSTSPPSGAAEEILSRLMKVRFMASGINMLMPGQEYTSYWTDVRTNTTEKFNTQTLIKTKCRDATGRTYDRQHLIEFSELDGIERLGRPPLLVIAEALKKLQGDVHALRAGPEKLGVDCYTNEDRERQAAERAADRADWERQYASRETPPPDNPQANHPK